MYILDMYNKYPLSMTYQSCMFGPQHHYQFGERENERNRECDTITNLREIFHYELTRYFPRFISF